MVQCKAIKKDGGICSAAAIKGEDYCLFHSQSKQIVSLRLSKAQIGGFKKRRLGGYPTANLKDVDLKDVKNALGLLEILVKDTYQDRIAFPKAQALIASIRLLLEAISKVNLEERIKKLEKEVFKK